MLRNYPVATAIGIPFVWRRLIKRSTPARNNSGSVWEHTRIIQKAIQLFFKKIRGANKLV
jgi:hypothetical protein